MDSQNPPKNICEGKCDDPLKEDEKCDNTSNKHLPEIEEDDCSQEDNCLSEDECNIENEEFECEDMSTHTSERIYVVNVGDNPRACFANLQKAMQYMQLTICNTISFYKHKGKTVKIKQQSKHLCEVHVITKGYIFTDTNVILFKIFRIPFVPQDQLST
ncbi:MAG TPA: hypothetical protein VLE02_01940 [Nitrosarchaeum sp.]|nr:hypothetical protein [Nitrosarchaeum sp.]